MRDCLEWQIVSTIKLFIDWNRTHCTAQTRPPKDGDVKVDLFFLSEADAQKWLKVTPAEKQNGSKVRPANPWPLSSRDVSCTSEINSDLGDCVLKRSITKLETCLQSPSMRNTRLPPRCSHSVSEALLNFRNHLWTYSCIYSIESEKYVCSEGECIRSTPRELIIDYYLTFRIWPVLNSET